MLTKQVAQNKYYSISNSIVYLHAVAMFFPHKKAFFLPFGHSAYRSVIFILSLSLILALLFERSLKQDIKRVPTPFYILAFYTLIQILLIYLIRNLGLDPVEDPVRINIQTLVYGPFLFVNGLLVYFTISKNHWGYAEFEKLFKILLVVCTVVAVECILTYYMGLFPAVRALSDPVGARPGMIIYWFNSIFIAHRHIVGRFGLILVFLSLYFWAKNKKKTNLLFFLCSWLITLGSGSRASIFSALLGMAIFIFFAVRLYWFRKIRDVGSRGMLIAVVPIVLILFSAIVLQALAYKRPNFMELSVGTNRRLDRNIRALDILLHRPFGTGLGLNMGYLYSDQIPTTISENFERRSDVVLSGSMHNSVFDKVIELGWVGFIFFVYLLFYEIKILFNMPKLLRKVRRRYFSVSAISIYALVPSLFLSITSTSTAKTHWLFGVVIAFQLFIYKDLQQTAKLRE